MDRPTKRRGPLTWLAGRSRRWWVPILLAILYVASFGPACWISSWTGRGVCFVNVLYQPVMQIGRYSVPQPPTPTPQPPAPMPRHRLSRVERAHRRKRVAELHLRGHSQVAIAEKLKVHQGTVARDLAALCLEWRASSLRDFDRARGEVLKKLDEIERAAWRAWDLSRAPHYAAQVTTENGKESTRKSLVHREGNTKYLDTIQQCTGPGRSNEIGNCTDQHTGGNAGQASRL
ncbi:MAG: hypothetical protein ACT4QC_20180 [Planctomycetaceae bacterium]